MQQQQAAHGTRSSADERLLDGSSSAWKGRDEGVGQTIYQSWVDEQIPKVLGMKE